MLSFITVNVTPRAFALMADKASEQPTIVTVIN